MWIKRDFNPNEAKKTALPIKILTGPRQVGKTSLLQRLDTHQVIFLDDMATRLQAEQDPRFFLDQLSSNLVIDEAPLAPNLFTELKRRVDEARTQGRQEALDFWLTGSNQTLMQKVVRESLAGRANYFTLNTLSIHELKELWNLKEYLFRGGWPELYTSPHIDPVRYLNDLIATFIEKDIVAAAGIERRAAFLKTLHLAAGRIGQLFNASDIATNVGIDSTTVQSWLSILEINGIMQKVPAYFTNLNKRLTKSAKYYFQDVALASRLQGWTSIDPLIYSPSFGHFFENMVLGEISRFFVNKGIKPVIHYVRSKEKVEVDFLINLGNQKFLALEAKVTPENFTDAQRKLLDSLDLSIVEKWIVSGTKTTQFKEAKVVQIADVWGALEGLVGS